MPDAAGEAPERTIAISANAARRVKQIKESEGDDGLLLRVAVDGGGCSGFQYGFSLDDSVHKDDRVFEENGVRVVIDEASLDLLAGSQVDFVEELGGSFFSMKNPNAASTCGCGNSFAI